MKSKFNVSAVYWKITILLIIAKLCLHLFTNTNYELHRDEMLYFNMADNLSFGYATVPPLTGFLAFIVKGLFGYSVFGIRLLPAILGALSLFIIAKIIRKLGRDTCFDYCRHIIPVITRVLTYRYFVYTKCD
ncbi:MAG: hypothetical protein IPJ37_07010 [Bacteroidales bacterium]|nr:hypothetical protein [Bacteroidales bacterium]